MGHARTEGLQWRSKACRPRQPGSPRTHRTCPDQPPRPHLRTPTLCQLAMSGRHPQQAGLLRAWAFLALALLAGPAAGTATRKLLQSTVSGEAWVGRRHSAGDLLPQAAKLGRWNAGPSSFLRPLMTVQVVPSSYPPTSGASTLRGEAPQRRSLAPLLPPCSCAAVRQLQCSQL